MKSSNPLPGDFDTGPAKDLLAFKLTALKLIFEWSPYLSVYERCLALWLLGNTIGRGKYKGSYTISHMKNGIPRKNGHGKWCEGCGISEAKLHRVIRDLEDKGLIWVSRNRNRGSTFVINLDWTPTPGAQSDERPETSNCQRPAPEGDLRPDHVANE